MNLFSAFRLSNESRVAFVGSGGKTSAITNLAKTNPCLISTTTHIGSWQSGIAQQHVIIENPSDWDSLQKDFNKSTLVTKPLSGNRYSGFDHINLNRCLEICEKFNLPLYLECDGSRQLPLKFPSDHEPPIPSFVDTVVVTCGLSGLGKPLDSSSTYHYDLFSHFTGLPIGSAININGLKNVLSHPLGGLKNIPDHARRILLINQADSPILQSIAGDLANQLKDVYDSIVISSLLHNQIQAVFEPSAGIILAAGSSSRFGKPKQVLKYQGSNFINTIISSSIMGGLSPIVVVTGSNQEVVLNSIGKFLDTIFIVNNPEWQEGQSSSIRRGMEALDQLSMNNTSKFDTDSKPAPGSVTFLLADLPQVNSTLIKALSENHSMSLFPVIAPLVDGQRANPVLFDRATFPALKNLKGDIGGRGIFHLFPPKYIPWVNDSILMDIDTVSDYSKLNHE